VFWPVKSGGGFNAAPTLSPSSSSSESDDETCRNFPRKNTIEDARGSSCRGRGGQPAQRRPSQGRKISYCSTGPQGLDFGIPVGLRFCGWVCVPPMGGI
jgi:hypothetical protein